MTPFAELVSPNDQVVAETTFSGDVEVSGTSLSVNRRSGCHALKELLKNDAKHTCRLVLKQDKDGDIFQEHYGPSPEVTIPAGKEIHVDAPEEIPLVTE